MLTARCKSGMLFCGLFNKSKYMFTYYTMFHLLEKPWLMQLLWVFGLFCWQQDCWSSTPVYLECSFGQSTGSSSTLDWRSPASWNASKKEELWWIYGLFLLQQWSRKDALLCVSPNVIIPIWQTWSKDRNNKDSSAIYCQWNTPLN